jgi:outer membrane cobalamin receptor
VSVHELEEVRVTDRFRTSVVRSATPLQVTNKDEIARKGYQDMGDVVRRFSGVSVKDYGGIGGLKTVSVRNLGANHTAVSYDGVVVGNTQAGQIDIGRFSLDNVETVSLAIGQEEDIFQPARIFASGGVLGIRTQIPYLDNGRKHELHVQVKGGSFGMLNPSVRYSQRLSKRLRVSVNGNYLRADGSYPFRLVNGNNTTHEKRRNSDIVSWQAEGNLYGEFKDSSTLNVKAYYFDSERGLPGAVILYNPYHNERLWDKLFFAQAQYKKALSARWDVAAQLKYNYSWNKYENVDVKYEGGRQIDRNTQNEY